MDTLPTISACNFSEIVDGAHFFIVRKCFVRSANIPLVRTRTNGVAYDTAAAACTGSRQPLLRRYPSLREKEPPVVLLAAVEGVACLEMPSGLDDADSVV